MSSFAGSKSCVTPSPSELPQPPKIWMNSLSSSISSTKKSIRNNHNHHNINTNINNHQNHTPNITIKRRPKSVSNKMINSIENTSYDLSKSHDINVSDLKEDSAILVVGTKSPISNNNRRLMKTLRKSPQDDPVLDLIQFSKSY
ncbi:hypothetical protein SSS_00239 [Sarcoptes scabiei]|uniref:Uncharacterized protein n=1 Tax=Sarcoptes scabiei TaxID=52283 RepID=A0A834RBU4_SARSC|nr:hypothetical protein SSS_00239 [Sarcoptes scabiei]